MPVDDLRREDRAAWEVLYRAYADFYRRPVTAATLDTIWVWIFDESMAFHALVARDAGDEPIGLLHFRAMPSPLRGQMIGFADDLYVQPGWRGRGMADALFAELKSRAAGRGWSLVRWITAADNHRAMAVYDRVARRTDWQTYEMDCLS